MEKKQNSIDQLELDLEIWFTLSGMHFPIEIKNSIQRAKAMHKEEIVNTWTEATAPPHEIGLSDTTYILAQIKKAEQYYNEHYEQ